MSECRYCGRQRTHVALHEWSDGVECADLSDCRRVLAERVESLQADNEHTKARLREGLQHQIAKCESLTRERDEAIRRELEGKPCEHKT